MGTAEVLPASAPRVTGVTGQQSAALLDLMEHWLVTEWKREAVVDGTPFGAETTCAALLASASIHPSETVRSARSLLFRSCPVALGEEAFIGVKSTCERPCCSGPHDALSPCGGRCTQLLCFCRCARCRSPAAPPLWRDFHPH
jgi:hypothetical protein